MTETTSPTPNAALTKESGPHTCCQCNAATWNDDDWCDECVEAARAENNRPASPSPADPLAAEDACLSAHGEPAAQDHGPQCWGRTSLSDEMLHCYCKPAAQADPAKGLGPSYLLMKRGLYYAPNALGYTGIRDRAGRYSEAEAKGHADEASGVTAILEADAPLIAPKCFDDIARDYLTDKLATATRKIAELEAREETLTEILRTVCGHLGLPQSESGPADDVTLYDRALENLLAGLAETERQKVEHSKARYEAEADAARVREALEPFAKAADFWEAIYDDSEVMKMPAAFVDAWRNKHGKRKPIPQFVNGDLRKARAALTQRGA